jgi:hypothetical protein
MTYNFCIHQSSSTMNLYAASKEGPPNLYHVWMEGLMTKIPLLMHRGGRPWERELVVVPPEERGNHKRVSGRSDGDQPPDLPKARYRTGQRKYTASSLGKQPKRGRDRSISLSGWPHPHRGSHRTLTSTSCRRGRSAPTQGRRKKREIRHGLPTPPRSQGARCCHPLPRPHRRAPSVHHLPAPPLLAL